MRRWPRRRRAVVLVALAALVAVLTTAIVLVAVDRSEASSRLRDRAEAVAAARASAERILSFDGRTLDADVDRARASVAGEFADQYDAIARSLIETVGRSPGTGVRSTVTRAGVVSDTSGGAGRSVTVLLFVDQTATGASPPPARPASVQLEVTVTRAGGQWLVSGLRPL